MFSVIKEKLNFVEVAEELLDVPFKLKGDQTWVPDDVTCPLCGHRDCFHVKEDGPDSLFKCFSCDEGGDLVALVAKVKDLTNGEAAHWLVKKYNLKLPNDYSPVQQLFNTAAEYYHSLLLEAGPYAELGGLTPLEYQLQRRGHVSESLSKHRVGWSDGKLCDFLESVGTDPELLLGSGLKAQKGSWDFLPGKCFIYPHFVRGRVSHFTFKDPMKKKDFQLNNKFKLNGHAMYGCDSLRKEGTVIIVEGENDLLSVEEATWPGAVLCTNGNVSRTQWDWLEVNLRNRDVITIFDTDPAGDGYREKATKVKSFKSLKQVKVSGGAKDIDEYLKSGGDLRAILTSAESGQVNSTEVEVEPAESGNLFVKSGGYYKVRYKDGKESLSRLTNFTIKLRNIFIRNGNREREIIIIKDTGQESKPIIIPSEAKVSIKPFKVLVANAVDATFYGQENDLADLWEYVYSLSDERIVDMPSHVGRIEEFKGWLLRDRFLADSGEEILVSDDGVIWIEDKVGIKPVSITSSTDATGIASGIPKLNTELSDSEVEEFLKGFVQQLATNLGGEKYLGHALTCVGFLWSCVYSNMIFHKNGNFPFLYLWGTGGQGKTTIIRQWLLNFFNMGEYGWTTISNLNSGVGWGRKMAYYGSLPMSIDELRANDETTQLHSRFRGYYDRASRDTANRDDRSQINSDRIRSCMIFGGEDQFTDPATRQRCIPIRIPRNFREMKVTYNWIESRKENLSNIGYYWIKNFSRIPEESLVKGLNEIEAVLRGNGVPSRIAVNWSVAGLFGNLVAKRHFPEFDFPAFLSETADKDTNDQAEDSTVAGFFDIVEGLQVSQRQVITGDHIRVDGNFLYIWFADLFRIIQREDSAARDKFSKRAILEAIREEPWYLGSSTVTMGTTEVGRRVIKLNLTECPEVLLNIANFSRM